MGGYVIRVGSNSSYLNLCGAEAGIFRAYSVDTVADDALALCVGISAAAIVLVM